MEIIKHIISNGYTLFIPILLWNVLLTKHLPPAYQMKAFNSNIPHLIAIGERIGRIAIFGLPLFLKLNYSSPLGKTGLLLFIVGVVLYFSSWVVLILRPECDWSKSLFGFTAPAYSIIIWLTGFALLADSYYFELSYSKWHYIIPSVIMVTFHFSHSRFVFIREYR